MTPPRAIRARRGEVWACGAHRIMCGDSTVAADVDRLCAGARPTLLLTDPPYGVAVGERNAATGAGVKASLKNDDLDEAGLRTLWGGGVQGSVACPVGEGGVLLLQRPGSAFDDHGRRARQGGAEIQA